MRVLGSRRPESAEIPAEMIDRIGDQSALNTFLHHASRHNREKWIYIRISLRSWLIRLRSFTICTRRIRGQSWL